MSGKVSKAMVQFGWENICWTNGISGIKKMDEGLPNLGGIEENENCYVCIHHVPDSLLGQSSE